MSEHAGGATYAGAGVDLAAGDEAVERIKKAVAAPARPGVLGGIGGFGGLFALDTERYRHPVLVSSTDGVGTKLLVAQATGRWSTVGIDLVAMCVDDRVCAGAEPLFLLDYVAVGRLVPERVEQVVAGISQGCRPAGRGLGRPVPGAASSVRPLRPVHPRHRRRAPTTRLRSLRHGSPLVGRSPPKPPLRAWRGAPSRRARRTFPSP